MRIESFIKKLPSNIDGALIISQQNRRYFTSFDSSDGFLLITRQGSVFFTDSRYIEAARNTIKCCDVIEGTNVFSQMRDYLKARGAMNIAVEAGGITVAQFNNLMKHSELQDFAVMCIPEVDDAINEIRSVKSEDEIKLIKEAQAIAEKGFLHILDFIKEGRTEREIQLELDYYMLKNGAEALSFDTIAVSGINSSMPHGVPSYKPVKNGDFITMDFGAVKGGYHSDMTRTVAVGDVTDEQREIYSIVLKAQQGAIDAIAAGVNCADADRAAREIIENAGYGNCFGHGTGHGVGIEIHEMPNLSPRSQSVLKAGNVVTAEPGIYIPGKFGVRIEDMVLVTEDSCIDLTSSDKSLIIL